MRLTEIITKAQVLSGVGEFEGNAIDENLMAKCLSIFHDTLNDINNDATITLVLKELNYQTYTENAITSVSSPSSNTGWVNAVPIEEPPTIAQEEQESLFPDGTTLPFSISNEYPLPNDCRRVVKALDRNIELRKTNYAEIIRGRNSIHGLLNMYAVNDGKVSLIRPAPITIIYAKEFPDYMPQDEVDLPKEALSYVINVTAYNYALTWNGNGAERCRLMAQKSYVSLVDNLSVNEGDRYVNMYLSLNRHSRRWVG